MKAIRVSAHGGPDALRYEQVDDPSAGAGQVVVRVHAVGVNPVDTYIRAGAQGYSARFPYTPGLDAAGVVEEVGAGVRGVVAGDRVYCAGTVSGAYAEKALCHASQVHPLPDSVSFEQGACIGVPYVTAHYALFRRGRAVAGETVLVHGASGGVGTAAVQLAKAHGLRVAGTAGSVSGRELVAAQGAERVFDHHDPSHGERVLEWTSGAGVDVILEMLANVNLGGDLSLLARGGRVVVIGSRGDATINPRDVMKRNADIRGMALLFVSAEELVEAHEALADGLRRGALRPVVGHVLPLAEAGKAHERIMQPPALGNVVLRP